VKHSEGLEENECALDMLAEMVNPAKGLCGVTISRGGAAEDISSNIIIIIIIIIIQHSGVQWRSG